MFLKHVKSFQANCACNPCGVIKWMWELAYFANSKTIQMCPLGDLFTVTFNCSNYQIGLISCSWLDPFPGFWILILATHVSFVHILSMEACKMSFRSCMVSGCATALWRHTEELQPQSLRSFSSLKLAFHATCTGRHSQSLPSWRHRGWTPRAWITIFNTPTLDEHLERRQGGARGINYNQDLCTCHPVWFDFNEALAAALLEKRGRIHRSKRITCYFWSIDVFLLFIFHFHFLLLIIRS